MELNVFPNNPSEGDTVTVNGIFYQYTSGVWNVVSKVKTNLREVIKRQAAEAGFNLVDGSFEEGANVSGWPDVVWSQTNGKYYQWKSNEAKTIPAGSTPTNIGVDWIDRSDVTLRSDLNVVVKVFESVADMIADESLVVGQKCRTLGYYTVGDGGGAIWDVVLASTVTPNGYNIVACTGVPTLALVLRVNSIANVKQFGAVGDNLNDDTGAIQAAIDYLNSQGGGEVRFDIGGYKVTSTLNLYNSVYLAGQGINTYPHNIDGCYIQKAFNGNLFEFDGKSQSVFEDGWGIRDINLFGDGLNYTGKAIYVNNGTGFQLHNVVATRFTENVFHFYKCGTHKITHCRPIETFGADGESGIFEEESGDWHIDSCDFGNTPIYRDSVLGVRARASTGRISNCKIFFTKYAVFSDQSNLQVSDNTFNDNYLGAVRNNGFDSVYTGNLVYNIESVNVPSSTFIAFEDVAGRSAFVGNLVKYLSGSLLCAFRLNNVSKSIVTGNICSDADGPVIYELGGIKNTIVGNHFGGGSSSNITYRNDDVNSVQDAFRFTSYSNGVTTKGFGVGIKYSAVYGADGSSPTDLGYADYSFNVFNQAKIVYSMQYGGKKPYMTVEAKKVSFESGINLGGLPINKSNGDVWYDSDTNELKARIADVDRVVALV